MSEKLHCPVCLKPLDKNGDCWPVCNYESKSALPEYAPLNRKQVLEKLLFRSNAKINVAYARIDQLRIEVANYERELESLAT